MELVIVLIVVGVIVGTVVWVASAAARGRREPDEAPDTEQVTDRGVVPPPDPASPVPGSAPDRARKGHTDDQVGSEVARRRG